MIRVNLIGVKKKAGKAGSGRKIALPTSVMPFVLALIVLGTGGFGYWWYSDLSAKSVEMDSRISSAQAQKAALDAVIKQNQVFESRKKTLENRIKVIESLKRNQVNPVLAMDVLSEALEKTQYVWLSQLDQTGAVLNMAGTGTSLDAISDFYTNLDHSGYFRNIDLANATETNAAGNYTFSLKAEFSPPKPAAAPAKTGGGN